MAIARTFKDYEKVVSFALGCTEGALETKENYTYRWTDEKPFELYKDGYIETKIEGDEQKSRVYLDDLKNIWVKARDGWTGMIFLEVVTIVTDIVIGWVCLSFKSTGSVEIITDFNELVEKCS